MAKQPTDNRRRNRVPVLDNPAMAAAKDTIEPAIRTRPANENDPGTAIMLQRLRRPPSYDVIIIAAVISVIWVAGWFWIYKEIMASQQVNSPSEFLQAIALLVLPVFGMLTIAYFQWRAQQLRQVSEVLMHQAMRLIRPQDIATDGLTSIAQAVRQEVDLLVGGVEHAFQRASALEEIVHKEISAVERAFGSNEDRIRSLVNGLETQRAALQQTSNLVNSDAQPMLSRLESNTQNLGQVINLALSTFGRLEDGLKSSTGELARTIEDVAQRAAETGQEIGTHSTQFERMSTMLVSDFRGFSSQLQEYIQTLNFTASNLGSETRKFGTEVKGMESSLLQMLGHSTEQLIGAHQDVAQTVERLSNSASNNAKQSAAELVQTYGQLGEAITYQLKSVSGDAAAMIERVGADTATRIEQSNALVTQGLQSVASDYLQKLSLARGDLANHVDQVSARLAADMDTAAVRFNDRFMQTGTQLVGSMDQTSNALISQLGASGSGLMGALQASAERHTMTLNESVERLDHASNTVASSLNRASTLVAQEMQGIGANVNDLLVSTSGTIAAHLKETSEIVSRQMQDSGLALAQNIETSGGLVTDRLINVSGEFVQKFNTTRDGLLTAFLGASGDLSSKLEHTSMSIYARLQDVTADLTGQMSGLSESLSGRIDGAGRELTGKLDATSSHMFAGLDKATLHFTDQLETVAARVNETIEGTAGQATDRIVSVTENLTGKMDASSTQLGTLLVATERRLGNQLEQASTELEALFNENTRMLTEQLDQSSNTVTNSFATTAVNAASTLTSAAREVTDKIEGASQSMFDRLHGTTRELGERFDLATDHLEVVTTEISKRLDGQGKRFAEVLDTASGQIFTDLGKARDAFSEGLGETTLQISGRFEQETGLLVGRIDKAVSEFDSASSVSANKLDDASKKFAKHVETTNIFLADQLASAAGDIDSRLESVSMQLTGKLEMTGSRISERLEDVSSLVDKSVDKFNLEMEHMLQNRRDLLDNLVNDANRRASEVDKTMSGYMNLIEESLSAAEGRAQHISRLVADQSSAALGRLEEELRKLETNSSAQVSQAARALREQHERALSNMNEMLSSTASDFQQTAQDMRITAQQVVKDIDAARGELKRAVIDLPEETRSNADAMRRVVADQISALNALADVVRKQTGTLDFSGPGFMSPRTPAPAETSTFQASYREPARVAAPAPAPRVEAPQPASAPKIAALAKEVDTFNTKLNVSARDVVEAIEGQLPRDLEKRYAASDKSVYTLRLYESRSRKLIKALEGRYAEERLLRSRIQAYNRLFEKLLDSVSETDGAEAVMEQVLGSEQGRIYVMLAEVAGRLPSQS